MKRHAIFVVPLIPRPVFPLDEDGTWAPIVGIGNDMLATLENDDVQVRVGDSQGRALSP
jgi:hypothetical protein